MIDMSSLYEHKDYQEALNNFNISNCKWNSFVDIHLKIANNRCPICEYSFEDVEIKRTNKNDENLLIATIDHYRPQKYYPFLKCEHKNYLLMCFECNSSYKKSKFPIYNSTIRATHQDRLEEEQVLITNPINDDIYELFILVFKQSDKILELKPKVSSGYLRDKAIETIKVFGLGNCEEYRHKNDDIHHCRIRILKRYFTVFYKFAKALNDRNRIQANLEFKNNQEMFKSYGFFEFLKRQQFEILV